MSTLIIEFTRIGRSHTVPPLRVQGHHVSAEYVETEIRRYARRFLRSREFDVDVYMPYPDGDGEVFIDGGRFGQGTVKLEETVAA